MRGYVGPPGAQVHYRRAGDAGPAVILFHESPQSSNVYDRVLAPLGRTARVVALDTPGYGMSDPPERPLEIPGYAALLLDAIDALGIDEFAVVGQHTGASIALEVGLAAAGRVTHAVLSGLALFDDDERRRYLDGWAPDLAVPADGSHLQDLWRRYLRLWEEPPELVNLSIANITSIFDRYNWAYNAAFRHDPAEALAAIDCPVLLLIGARDLLVDGDERALRIRPDAERRVLTDSTGQLPYRVPQEWTRIVSDFVTRA